MSEINTLYPQESEATISGVTAKIQPIKLKNIHIFAELSGHLTALLANVNPLSLVKFCNENAEKSTVLLTDQTSLTAKQIETLTANDLVMWLSQIVWANLSDFNQALSQQAGALRDGAKSISD